MGHLKNIQNHIVHSYKSVSTKYTFINKKTYIIFGKYIRMHWLALIRKVEKRSSTQDNLKIESHSDYTGYMNYK